MLSQGLDSADLDTLPTLKEKLGSSFRRTVLLDRYDHFSEPHGLSRPYSGCCKHQLDVLPGIYVKLRDNGPRSSLLPDQT